MLNKKIRLHETPYMQPDLLTDLRFYYTAFT